LFLYSCNLLVKMTNYDLCDHFFQFA
jgi:hypothetical protein